MDSAAAEEVVDCPLCAKYFSVSFINEHVNECLNNTKLEDEVDFEESIISEDPLSSTDDQSTIEHSFDLATHEPFHSTLDSSGSSVSQQKMIVSCSLQATKSPKDKWSFLKFPKAAAGQTGLGQTGKTSTSKNPSQISQSTNFTNSKKHSFDLGSGQNDERPTTANSKRIKLQSSGNVLSNKVFPNNEGSADIRTKASISERSAKTVPSENRRNTVIPLAERMRPGSLDDFVGQKEVVGSRTLLRRLLESDNFPSMILWGPPGCGKTTLARIVANRCRHLSSWRFAQLSATMSGISDIKEAVQVAKNEKSSFRRKTVLFIDEIHRFNKLQQDTFLPHVEDGTIILIGATTENPSFNINSALLSRCKVLVLEKLSSENIGMILKRGLREINVGILSTGNEEGATSHACNGESVKMFVESDVVDLLSQMCDGDARCALNSLQNLVDSKSSVDTNGVTVVTVDDARDALQRSHVQYDRLGEEHYNCASALQKSIRGSSDDGAIYWLARMLEGGEDPLFIARRLLVCASEDIGMADAHALPIAVSTFQACHFLGMPECALNLAHCTTYLARAPKSNEAYAALNRARESIRKHVGPLPGVPLHLRNAPTKLMKDLGYHKGYQYNHNIQGPVNQEYLPKQLLGTSFFKAPF